MGVVAVSRQHGRRIEAATYGGRLRIPIMSISHSDLMPIRSERSDAGPSQCELVIDMSQQFLGYLNIFLVINEERALVAVFGC